MEHSPFLLFVFHTDSATAVRLLGIDADFIVSFPLRKIGVNLNLLKTIHSDNYVV